MQKHLFLQNSFQGQYGDAEKLEATIQNNISTNTSFINGNVTGVENLDDKKLLNLSSNNYLGLADNKLITKEFLKNGGAEFSFGIETEPGFI